MNVAAVAVVNDATDTNVASVAVISLVAVANDAAVADINVGSVEVANVATVTVVNVAAVAIINVVDVTRIYVAAVALMTRDGHTKENKKTVFKLELDFVLQPHPHLCICISEMTLGCAYWSRCAK